VTYTAGRLAGLLDEELSWLSVRTADRLPGPDWISCAAVLEEQQSGGDPTAGWRKALTVQYGEEYGVEPPAQLAAMFVLGWYISVPGRVAGMSLAITGVSPDVSPEALAFRLHPTQHFPADVALLSDKVLALSEVPAVLDKHCRGFADSYRPGVKLSSRQRHGAIEDEVRFAVTSPEEAPYAGPAAAALGVDLAQQIRTSCCFIYVLPGITPCAGCPRVR